MEDMVICDKSLQGRGEPLQRLLCLSPHDLLQRLICFEIAILNLRY